MAKLQNTSYQIGVAAEAFAAAFFARLGYDVSVQYGANQPEYDLMIASDDKMLKVSVKGSQDGSWGLTQSFLRKDDYHESTKKWLNKHGKKTIFCLVQFQGVALNEAPRIYLAQPTEIAKLMDQSRNGNGATILYEYKKWNKNAIGYPSIDSIPDAWKMSKQRINELFEQMEGKHGKS